MMAECNKKDLTLRSPVVRVRGQVLHMHPAAGAIRRPGMGVKFQDIGDAEREFVRDFIRKELLGGLAAD